MNNLKIVSMLLSLALSAGMFISCSGGSSDEVTSPEDKGNVTISVSPEALESGSDVNSLQLNITCNADWSIRTEASWINLRPAGGVKNESCNVTVTLQANPEFDTRSAILDIVSGGKVVKSVTVTQGFVKQVSASLTNLTVGGQGGTSTVTITSNTDWQATVSDDWMKVSPAEGAKGETSLQIITEANKTTSDRQGYITITYGDSSFQIKILQLYDEIITPEGYTLVWSDEFNEGTKPGSDWVIENQPAGWVNHELQTYTSREIDGKSTLEVKDGFLHINCFKASDGKIYSGRMNAKPGTGWTYGYFEARINLPKGKGTWPAFWMMPSNVDWNTNPWPKCGEIDIMEEVGVDANRVSSSLHTQNYNHTKNTQKTHEMNLPGAEGEFHIYALEWTEDAITTYVDGKVQLRATKAEMGSDHDSWPFHYAFYPILNLAWGGDWGGYAGVNENALPVTMLVDYVRIFQKQ